jgi:hypothetical protein
MCVETAAALTFASLAIGMASNAAGTLAAHSYVDKATGRVVIPGFSGT